VTPAWILDVLAALMLVVATVSAARIAAARPWRRGAVVVDTDVAHLLMALAMAGMLAPALGTLPDVAWEVAFALLAAWFASRVLADARRSGIRALAGGHCAPHLVHSGAMLYMFLAVSPAAARTGGMSGMAGGPETASMALSHPTLAFIFAFILVGYAIWDLDQLSGRRYATGAGVSLAGAGAVGAVSMTVLAGIKSLPVPPGAAPADAAPDTDLAAMAADARAAPARDDHATASRGGGAACAGGPHPGGGGAFLLSPAVTVGCRITMSIAMAFMLLIAL
jgi:Domain of unknown function (DUF5134)